MKSVIISGGSHGIGAAAVELFSENGWRVLLGYEKAEREARKRGEKIIRHTVARRKSSSRLTSFSKAFIPS